MVTWRDFKRTTGGYWQYLPTGVRDVLHVIDQHVQPLARIPNRFVTQVTTGDYRGAYNSGVEFINHIKAIRQYNSRFNFGYYPNEQAALDDMSGKVIPRQRRRSDPVRYGGNMGNMPDMFEPVHRFVNEYVNRQRRKSRNVLSVHGSYGKRFKRPKKKKPAKLSMNGAMITWDFCAQHDTPGDQSVFLGHHTTPGRKLIKALTMCLVRKLFMKAGIAIGSFRDEVWNPFQTDVTSIGGIFYMYKWHDQTIGWTAQLGSGVTISNDQTYIDVAASLENAFRADYTALDEEAQRTFTIKEIWLTAGITAANNTWKEAILNLDGAKVHIKSQTKLKMQNISTAEAGAAGDHAHELVGHVEQNPMSGKVYELRGANVLAPKVILGSVPFGTEGVADNDDGYLEFETANVASAYQTDFKRPPSRHYFKRVQQQGPASLQPGQIRTSTLTHNTTIYLNKLFKLFRGNFNSANVKEIAYFGKTRVFAFEKSMHTDADNEPNMRLAWELHGFIGVGLTCGRRRAVPTVLVSTTTGTTDR